MSHTASVLIGVAFLVAAGMFATLRIAAASDLAMLPASCRRRLRWWQVNARTLYLGLAALAVLCMAVQVPGLST